MKPMGPVARRRDYEVRIIPHALGAAFITANHYAKGCSNTSTFMFGLFRENRLVGAALFLPPTAPAAKFAAKFAAKVTGREVDWRNVLALSRTVLLDSEPTNAESLLVGAAIREIRRHYRWGRGALLTYADSGENHTGTIYRASNWHEAGEGRAKPRWVDPESGRIVGRKATVDRSVKRMEALGYVRAGSFSKARFVYAWSKVRGVR